LKKSLSYITLTDISSETDTKQLAKPFYCNMILQIVF